MRWVRAHTVFFVVALAACCVVPVRGTAWGAPPPLQAVEPHTRAFGTRLAPQRVRGVKATTARVVSNLLFRVRKLAGNGGARVAALHIKHTDQRGDPMQPMLSVTVDVDVVGQTTTGYGIRGDRNARAGRDRRNNPAHPKFDPHYLSKRQVTLLDVSELAQIEGFVGAKMEPGDMREQVTVAGIPNLTALPKGTLLELGGATFELTGETVPCKLIGQYLDAADPQRLQEQLVGRRGVLARVVERRGTGRLLVGDPIRIVTPPSTAR